VLAACGGDDDDDAAGGTTTSAAPEPGGGEASLIRFFADGIAVAGASNRLVFGVGDAEGIPQAEAPDELLMRVAPDGGQPGEPIRVPRHDQGVPRPYFPLVATFDKAGVHTVTTEVDGAPVEASFTVSAPDSVQVPGPGDPLVPVVTPTTTDARGVTPICTREQICPLHDVTLEQAMGEGKPIALLIATPAFCQTAVCGPVLDILLTQHDEFADRVRMVHAEVYAHPEESLDETTEAVQAYRLTYEPVLFLAGADGMVETRLDNLYDEVEVRAALEALVA
jgi:hypothetical protein